jgi:hypothetical protein
MRQFAVIESEILERRDFIIRANRVFAIDPAPAQVLSSKGGQQTVFFSVGAIKDIELNCNYIFPLLEEDPLYKEVVKAAAVVVKVELKEVE